MGKQSRKEKYNQWDLEDSLTLEERRQGQREDLEKKLEHPMPNGKQTARMLSQRERLKKTGYII